jgi:hypothetical protein
MRRKVYELKEHMLSLIARIKQRKTTKNDDAVKRDISRMKISS